MSIEQELREAIATLSSLTDQHFLRALDGKKIPYLTIGRTGGDRSFTHDGDDGMVTSSIQISCFAGDYRSTKLLAQEVYALKAYTSSTVAKIKLYNEIDLYDSTTKVFQVALDFTISHYESD